MRETSFIDQNKEKWQEFEQLSRQPQADPDKLSDLFVQITDDLSYARTFYPSRTVSVYLNQLAQLSFYRIYKNRKSKLRNFIFFWKEELPYVLYHSRNALRLSLFVFLLALGVGVLSSAYDHDFPRVILGDQYVDMTEAYIEDGDPMAVYKQSNELDMFLGITINNIQVAFTTFVFGAVFAIGTIGLLLYNGIMVGAFQYFFISKGLFWTSFLTIWLHGTLEISSIVIAGGAGLVMGQGLVFPGTYNRMQAFALSARRGLKILLGTVPIFIFAALIEGFLTRYTEVPGVLRGALIAISALFILGYFVWYPVRKARSGFHPSLREEKLLPGNDQLKPTTEIKTNGTLFGESFLLLKHNFGKLAWAGLIAALTLVIGIRYIFLDEVLYNFTSGSGMFSSFENLPVLFNFREIPVLPIFHLLVFSSMMWLTTYVLKDLKTDPNARTLWKWKPLLQHGVRHFFTLVIPVALMLLIFYLPPPLSFFLFLLAMPIGVVWIILAILEGRDLVSSLGRVIPYLRAHYGRILGLSLMLDLAFCIFFFLLNSPVVWLSFEVLQWNFITSYGLYQMLYFGFLALAISFSLFLGISLVVLGLGVQYFTLVEIQEARHLKAQIQKLVKH